MTPSVFKPNGSGGYEPSSRNGRAKGGQVGSIRRSTGVAVDNSVSKSDPAAGDVYVVDIRRAAKMSWTCSSPSRRALKKDRKARCFGCTGSSPGLEEPNGVSVDSSTGEVFVADSERGAIYELQPVRRIRSEADRLGLAFGSFHGKEDEEGNIVGVAARSCDGRSVRRRS